MMSYDIEDGFLKFNGKEISLPCPVVESLTCSDLFIVRVEPPVGAILNKNVFAYGSNGSLKWEIEESPHGTENDKPYVSIFISEDGKLSAGNWNGVDYLVDLSAGKVVASAFNK